MKYILDTNICIYIIKNKPAKVLEKFNLISPDDVGISSITIAELQYGIFKSKNIDQNRAALFQFLVPLEIFSFDTIAAEAYGKIRNDLEKQGTIIGAMDMLIAAQALSKELTLVTNNEREFSRIPDLIIENWI